MWPFKKYLPDEIIIKELDILTCAFNNDNITDKEYSERITKLFKKATNHLLERLKSGY